MYLHMADTHLLWLFSYMKEHLKHSPWQMGALPDQFPDDRQVRKLLPISL